MQVQKKKAMTVLAVRKRRAKPEDKQPSWWVVSFLPSVPYLVLATVCVILAHRHDLFPLAYLQSARDFKHYGAWLQVTMPADTISLPVFIGVLLYLAACTFWIGSVKRPSVLLLSQTVVYTALSAPLYAVSGSNNQDYFVITTFIVIAGATVLAAASVHIHTHVQQLWCIPAAIIGSGLVTAPEIAALAVSTGYGSSADAWTDSFFYGTVATQFTCKVVSYSFVWWRTPRSAVWAAVIAYVFTLLAAVVSVSYQLTLTSGYNMPVVWQQLVNQL